MRTASSFEKRGEILKLAGLRHTKQRDCVFEVLLESDSPLSAQEIFDLLMKTGTHVDLSTVYRTLDTLEVSGVVRRILIENDSSAYFEFTGSGHRHYLICLKCRKIRSIEHCPLVSYEISLSKETDFRIEGHSLNIYGYCPECSDMREDKKD